jgi:putative MFS transporter
MVALAAAGPRKLQTLWEVINGIGIGPWQLRAQMVGGGMFLVDGAEIQTIAIVTVAVANELGLSPSTRGSLTSVVYLGVLLGGLASGLAGDTYGRRAPIVVGFAMLAIVALASSMAGSFQQLVVLRMMFGIFYGVGGPCWNTMAAEITPTSWRMVIAGISMVYFQAGELYSILIAWMNDPMMTDIDWRWQLAMSALPAIVCFIASLAYLAETPAFLAVHGEHERASEVLDEMRRLNGRPGVSIEYQPPAPVQDAAPVEAFWRRVDIAFGQHLRPTTLTLMYSFIVANFVFYGNLYVFPQVLPDVSDGSWGISPAASLALGVLAGEIPGVVAAALLGSLVPRRLALVAYLLLQAMATLIFGLHIDLPSLSPLQRGLLTSSYVAMRFACNFGFVILWQFTAETFPTIVRATGCAICFATGRIGAIVAPPLFEHMRHATGANRGHFLVCSMMCVANIFPIGLLQETWGKDLSDSMDMAEDDEQTPLVR